MHILLAVILTAAVAAPASAERGSSCDALGRASTPATETEAAQLIDDRADLPPFCQATGLIAGRIRFVMVPGHGHCWEQPGRVADDFNPLAVIDRWVENGNAPDHVIAVQKDDAGKVLRSRQLCPLPRVAEFAGGDSSRADSYRCTTPE